MSTRNNNYNNCGITMATSDTQQGQPPRQSANGASANAQIPDRSRLEETLVKSPMWKRQTMREIELNRQMAANESDNREQETARLFFRLSAQLDERNEEVDRLRKALSKLETQKSAMDKAHRRELERQQDELERLQRAYNQFEEESDSLLSELSQKNQRLLDHFRKSNFRSLLK